MTKAIPYNAATIYAVLKFKFKIQSIEYAATCLIEPMMSLCVMNYENIFLKLF